VESGEGEYPGHDGIAELILQFLESIGYDVESSIMEAQGLKLYLIDRMYGDEIHTEQYWAESEQHAREQAEQEELPVTNIRLAPIYTDENE
jgi:hypothetical protein